MKENRRFYPPMMSLSQRETLNLSFPKSSSDTIGNFKKIKKL